MKNFLAVLMLLASGLVSAATFDFFQPATGVLKGSSSTYVTSAATSADIRGLWTGSCDATTFLRGDGACATVSVPTGANPSATVGLSVTNGAAATFMRSDAAPALSQAITPTWSGAHVFSVVGTDAVPTIQLSSSLPLLSFKNTASAADEKQWDIDVSGNTLFLYLINDATNSARSWLKASRTGNSLTAVEFGNGLGDNPTYTFNGTGTTAFTGDVTVGGSSVCRENGTNCPAGGSSTVYPAFMLNDGTINIQVGWSAVHAGTGDFEVTTTIADSVECTAAATLPDLVGFVNVNVSSSGGFITMEVLTESSGGTPTDTNVNLIVACQ